MAAPKPRTFTAKPAERNGSSALLIGISAPSGGGKTYSALRVAMGIQRVVGGEIYFIDTDNGRALDYADLFRKPDGSPGFIHVPFEPPHGSLAFRDALRFCHSQPDCGVIITDSMSHEHIAMLEHAEAELDRMAGDNEGKRKAMKALSYAAPKAARTALLTEIQRLPVPGIFCFRAKEGIKPVKNEKGFTEFVQQGFTPIAGDEFVYEMTLCALLMPAAKGVPTWLPTEPGEKKMTKLPEQFSFLEGIQAPMDEKLGEGLAKWARGGPRRQTPQDPPQGAIEDQGGDMRDEAPPPASEPESDPAEDFPGDRTSYDETIEEMRTGQTRPVTDEDREEARRQAAEADEQRDRDQRKASRDSQAEAGEILARSEAQRIRNGEAKAEADPFADFADACADAEDWPAIVLALRNLTASESWAAAPYGRQAVARGAAYHALRTLVQRGKGIDFLSDAQAFRCYLEAEEEVDVLKLHWDAFKGGKIWPTLGAAQRAFETAVGRRLATLTGGQSSAADYT